MYHTNNSYYDIYGSRSPVTLRVLFLCSALLCSFAMRRHHMSKNDRRYRQRVLIVTMTFSDLAHQDYGNEIASQLSIKKWLPAEINAITSSTMHSKSCFQVTTVKPMNVQLSYEWPGDIMDQLSVKLSKKRSNSKQPRRFKHARRHYRLLPKGSLADRHTSSKNTFFINSAP